ncbi:unknown [Salmonella phage FelixO1]|uniref:Uncharacterized protein n=1 Tax=Salmonella phage Felix O1 (isolate Felix O1-VT1) TaxID=1283336 RepID=Q6KGB7_BPFO1|nr:unknown [Salmonella phage FelixO1]
MRSFSSMIEAPMFTKTSLIACILTPPVISSMNSILIPIICESWISATIFIIVEIAGIISATFT